ncbi:hypothetical protein TNCT_215051 [Trichonephila clavata]|uniref:Uncharacterized protein n=1 Tax=Trichonephila clavata TaxID=2740835 RepID=A0A8X6EWX7_TRICU|nr:hypothetical protein TNCT_215051 [Trichonephila clavata]
MIPSCDAAPQAFLASPDYSAPFPRPPIIPQSMSSKIFIRPEQRAKGGTSGGPTITGESSSLQSSWRASPNVGALRVELCTCDRLCDAVPPKPLVGPERQQMMRLCRATCAAQRDPCPETTSCPDVLRRALR